MVLVRSLWGFEQRREGEAHYKDPGTDGVGATGSVNGSFGNLGKV